MLGYTQENPFIYLYETDITSILENHFGKMPDDYFVLTQQKIKNKKTKEEFEVLFVEDKNQNKHTLFFKKN